MGDTLYRQAIVRVVNKSITEDSRWSAILFQTMADLQSGEYPQMYQDVIFQKHFEGIDIYDVYCFLQVHAWLRMGRLACFQIPVCTMPFSDRSIDENNNTLSQMPYPFEGEFIPSTGGGRAQDDGYIIWKEPVHAIVQRNNESGFVIVPSNSIESFSLPLEVGSTSAFKTFYYVNPMTGMGIARWPYGHDRITVLVHTNTCYGINSDEFNKMRACVYGDFNTFPNPYDDEWVI